VKSFRIVLYALVKLLNVSCWLNYFHSPQSETQTLLHIINLSYRLLALLMPNEACILINFYMAGSEELKITSGAAYRHERNSWEQLLMVSGKMHAH